MLERESLVFIFFSALQPVFRSSINTFGGNAVFSHNPYHWRVILTPELVQGICILKLKYYFLQFDRLKLERSTCSISFLACSTVHYSRFDIAASNIAMDLATHWLELFVMELLDRIVAPRLPPM